MAKNLERKMFCKNCNKTEIGKDPTDGKWYEVDNDTQLHFFKCPNKPKKEDKVNSNFETRLSNLEQAVKALVAQVGGQTTL